MIEGRVQLVHRLGTKGVTDLGPVEGNPHGAVLAGAVVGDVAEGEAFDLGPRVRVEVLGNHSGSVNLGP